VTDVFRARLETALAGTYTFESELGGGGMSRTYLAHEPSLDRRVVVKVLAPELLEGLSVERFKREVLMAAKLQHPHVVPVLASGDADGLPWFSMPFVAGESLRQRMLRGGIALDEAIGIMRDVARALAYAHSQGIVHRDIKPDNVLLSGGSATVTDFGIAKAISASRASGNATVLTAGGHGDRYPGIHGTRAGGCRPQSRSSRGPVRVRGHGLRAALRAATVRGPHAGACARGAPRRAPAQPARVAARLAV